MEYPVETFSEEEKARLAPHFTNLDRPVFAIVGLPETVKGAHVRPLLALPGNAAAALPRRVRGRRRPRAGLRGRGRARGPALRADLPRLRRRLRGAAGRCPRGVRVGLERRHEDPPAPTARRLPRAVHALHPLRRRDARRRLPLLAPPRARVRVRARDGQPVRHLCAQPARGRVVGGGPLPAQRQRAGVGVPALDQGEGARPAARPAAGSVAVAHGDIRDRPGIRAARAAPDGLAAPRGA